MGPSRWNTLKDSLVRANLWPAILRIALELENGAGVTANVARRLPVTAVGITTTNVAHSHQNGMWAAVQI